MFSNSYIFYNFIKTLILGKFGFLVLKLEILFENFFFEICMIKKIFRKFSFGISFFLIF